MTDEATQTTKRGEAFSNRVQALREKASDLSKTLDEVEKSLGEAAGEAKE